MAQHNVEAEDLKAQAVLNVVWLARTVEMVDVRLGQAHRLHDYLIDLVLHSVHGFWAIV